MKLIAICTGLVAPLVYRTASGDIKTEASGIKKQAVSTEQNPIPIELKSWVWKAMSNAICRCMVDWTRPCT